MAIPTLSAVEEEKRQAQAADEELQVCLRAVGLSPVTCWSQFLRERERRTLLRERSKAEKEEDAADEDEDEDEDDEYCDDDDDDCDDDDDDDVDAHPRVSGGGDARELRAMSSAGSVLRQALKSANRKESEFTAGKIMCCPPVTRPHF